MQKQGFGPNRRGKTRIRKILGPVLDFVVTEGNRNRIAKLRIMDFHETGFGLQCPEAISPGSTLRYTDDTQTERMAKVVWCQRAAHGEYRIGATFDVYPGSEGVSDSEEFDESEPDYYELLQINPKADAETIHRVYRLQAQRFHPDNKETGNEGAFKLLSKAYRTLSEPELRAAYDLKLNSIQQRRWKIFDQPLQAVGMEAEKRKRQGMLAILYTKRMQEPAAPHVSLHEFETLLGVPKEHLEFSLWYLRESAFVVRTDSGKFAITIKGVDELERMPGGIETQKELREDRLLN